MNGVTALSQKSVQRLLAIRPVSSQLEYSRTVYKEGCKTDFHLCKFLGPDTISLHAFLQNQPHINVAHTSAAVLYPLASTYYGSILIPLGGTNVSRMGGVKIGPLVWIFILDPHLSLHETVNSGD